MHVPSDERAVSFLLTLPFVEPQHTASKHRHGRRHEEGEGGRRPMEVWLVTLGEEIRRWWWW